MMYNQSVYIWNRKANIDKLAIPTELILLWSSEIATKSSEEYLSLLNRSKAEFKKLLNSKEL